MTARVLSLHLLLLVGLLTIWAGMPPATEAKGICRLPVKVGPCLAMIPRWHFDWRTRTCRPFNYGGCEGNANNFETRQECERVCGAGLPKSSSPGECPKPQGAGHCAEMCSHDGNCGPGEKCCSNGCGHDCMKVTGGAQRG